MLPVHKALKFLQVFGAMLSNNSIIILPSIY